MARHCRRTACHKTVNKENSPPVQSPETPVRQLVGSRIYPSERQIPKGCGLLVNDPKNDGIKCRPRRRIHGIKCSKERNDSRREHHIKGNNKETDIPSPRPICNMPQSESTWWKREWSIDAPVPNFCLPLPSWERTSPIRRCVMVSLPLHGEI